MTVTDYLLRLFCLLGSGFICGVAMTRAAKRSGRANKLALLALSAFAGSSMLSQFTLLHTHTSARTWFSVGATAVGAAYVVTVLHRPPPR